MIVSLCLAAIDCHLVRPPPAAFWIWWLGVAGAARGVAVLRRSPGCGCGGTTRRYRRWLYGSLVLLLFLWFGIPGLTSKSLLTAGNIAQNSPREIHGNKITGVITRFHELQANTVWVAAVLAVALAACRRQRDRSWCSPAGALLWVLIEIAFALHGFPAVPRYMFEAGAVVGGARRRVHRAADPRAPGAAVVAGVRRLDRSRIRRAAGAAASAPGAPVIVLAVIAGSMFGAAHRAVPARARRPHARARPDASLIGRLSVVVQKLGAARILACGQPNIPIELPEPCSRGTPDVKIGELYVSQTYERPHPHPLVNIYPHQRTGWKVFPSHVERGARAPRCSGLTLVYHGPEAVRGRGAAAAGRESAWRSLARPCVLLVARASLIAALARLRRRRRCRCRVSGARRSPGDPFAYAPGRGGGFVARATAGERPRPVHQEPGRRARHRGPRGGVPAADRPRPPRARDRPEHARGDRLPRERRRPERDRRR